MVLNNQLVSDDIDLLEISITSWPAYSATSVINTRSCPFDLRSKLNRDVDADEDPCDPEEDEDCEGPDVCDEESDDYDEDECETNSLRRRLRAAEERIKQEADEETEALRKRLQALRNKPYPYSTPISMTRNF